MDRGAFRNVAAFGTGSAGTVLSDLSRPETGILSGMVTPARAPRVRGEFGGGDSRFAATGPHFPQAPVYCANQQAQRRLSGRRYFLFFAL